jgi:glycosyltransferase involved in cell wall biosynthesis
VSDLKVSIAVHGRYHAFDLARGLHEKGHLAQLATTYPRFAAQRFLPPGVRLKSAARFEIWRRLASRFSFVPRADPGVSIGFGKFAARTLPDDAHLLVGWSSAIREAIEPAHARGMKVCVERGSTHILHQARVLRDAAARSNVSAPDTPPEIIERELWEYDNADAIAVPTRFAASTFIAEGVAAEKLIVNPYGVDPGAFNPREVPGEGPCRILFAGSVGVRKGVPDLLLAFDKLAPGTELHLAGPIENGMSDLIARHDRPGLIVHGPLPFARLKELYRSSTVFCLPSIEEGFAQVLLQAMASGLPVVTTDVAGGAELVIAGENGLIVPVDDPDALAGALSDMVADPDRTWEMGRQARRCIETSFRWSHYVDRAVDAYEQLVFGEAG